MTKYIFAIILMIIAIVGLSFTAISLGDNYMVPTLLFTQSLHLIECYVVLGIGIGLPIVILATVLGWVQLLLLLSGNIDPHLARDGFINVIKTLFNKI
jgi:hypothetical protein